MLRRTQGERSCSPRGTSACKSTSSTPTGRGDAIAALERDAGPRARAKNWKFTVRMVEPDGSVGKPFKMWMEQMGYYPKGTVPDAPPKKRGSLKEQRKQAAEAKKAKAEAKKAAAKLRRAADGEEGRGAAPPRSPSSRRSWRIY